MFLLKYTLLFLLSKKSELKPRFLYRNKVTKSSENAVSLVCNVGWVCFCGIIAAGVSCGGIAFAGVSLVVNVVVDGIVAVGGSVLVDVTLGGKVLVRIILGGSIVVGVALSVSDVLGGNVAVGVALGVNVAVRMCGKEGGIVGISGKVVVGGAVGIFSAGGKVTVGGNVTVELGCGSTLVVNVVDVICPFCFGLVLDGRVVVCLTEVGSLLSRGMSCVGEDLEGGLVSRILFRTSTIDLANFSFPISDR